MGRVDFSTKIAKSVAYGANLLLFLGGAGACVFVFMNIAYFQTLMEQATSLQDLHLNVLAPIIVFCAAGAVVLALIGTLALWKNIRIVLFAFLVCMFCLICFEGAGLGFMNSMSAKDCESFFKEDSQKAYQSRQKYQEFMKCCGWDYSTQEFFPERIACIALNPTFTTTCQVAVQTFIDDIIAKAYITILVVMCISLLSFLATLYKAMKASDKKEEDYFDNAFSG